MSTYKPDDEIIEGKYKIIKKLGNGAFGDIFRGKFALETNFPKLKGRELGKFMLLRS